MGACVNIQDHNRNTALIKAAGAGSKEIVHILIEAGADVNSFNEDGETSLMLAAFGGHASCLEELIRAVADVNSQNCRDLWKL